MIHFITYTCGFIHPRFQPLLREYPQGFADKVCSLLPHLVSGGERGPPIDYKDCPFQTFDGLPFTTWEEAKLAQVLRYLRGNKHLLVPRPWLEVFPKPLEVLHKLEQQRKAA